MSEVIPPAKVVYATGNTVTVTITRDSDDVVMVTDASCVESANIPGLFRYFPTWAIPTTFTTYTCKFTNGVYTQTGEIIMGGYDYQASQIDIPTVGEIDTQLSSTHGSGTWGTGVGSSVLDVTVTSSGEPIEGITVEVYTSSAKTGFVRKTTTDGAGLAHFDISAGIYYVWVLHSGYTGTNPTEVTV